MKKQLFKQLTHKWVLTSSLVAVLASTYSFRSFSQTQVAGEFNMSSTAKEEPADLQKSKTEGQAPAEGNCDGECVTAFKPITLQTQEDYEKFVARITQDILSKIESKPASEKQPEQQTEKPVEKELTAVEEECGIASADETRQEKRDRLDCEKDFKAQVKKDERLAKFEERMEKIQDKCDKDLDCLTSEFSSALSRYDGKNAIDAAIVNKYYKRMIEPEFLKSLYSDDQEKMELALSAINNLITEIPENYKSVKQNTMIAIQRQANTVAETLRKTRTDLQSANDPQKYFEALPQIEKTQSQFDYLTQSYSQTLVNSLQASNDTTAADYYRKSYLPDMNKLLILSRSTLSTGQQVNNQNPNQTLSEQTPGQSRDDRNQISPNQTTDINKMTQPTLEQNWNYLDQNQYNTINFGSPSSTSRGTRGGTQISQ